MLDKKIRVTSHFILLRFNYLGPMKVSQRWNLRQVWRKGNFFLRQKNKIGVICCCQIIMKHFFILWQYCNRVQWTLLRLK